MEDSDRGLLNPGDGYRVLWHVSATRNREELYIELWRDGERLAQELLDDCDPTDVAAVASLRNHGAVVEAACRAMTSGACAEDLVGLLQDLDALTQKLEHQHGTATLAPDYQLIDVAEIVQRQAIIQKPDGNYLVVFEDSHYEEWTQDEMAMRIPHIWLPPKDEPADPEENHEGEVTRYLENLEDEAAN